MGGDDELGAFLHKIPHDMQHSNLPCRRQCCFRFVKNVQPVSAEPVLHQSEEALAVGLLVKGFSAVGVDDIPVIVGGAFVQLLDIGSYIEETLGTEK